MRLSHHPLGSSRTAWRVYAILVLFALAYCATAPVLASGQRRAVATIEGYVTTDRPNVTPPPRTVEVFIPGKRDAEYRVEIDRADGYYKISNVIPRTYHLVAHNRRAYREDVESSFPIKAGNNRIDFKLVHFKKAGKMAGSASSEERLLPNTPVLLYLSEFNSRIDGTYTDERGKYEFDELAPGSYRVAIASKSLDGTEAIAFVPEIIQVMPEGSVALDLTAAWRDSELSVVGKITNLPAPSPAPREEVVVVPNIGNSIFGRIRFSGGPVPGVAVTITREEGRAQTTTTDLEGDFRFLNLEPGTYTVSGEASSSLSGFTKTGVHVSVSMPATVNVQLPALGSTDAPQIAVSDVTTNPSSINVSTEQFSNFPTQRTVQSLYTIAPTVARSGLRDSSGRDRDPSVGGSSGPENNYILDGVTVTDPAFGGSGANLPFEFVQELEIKTGAYGAEHGKSTGGIFNVITKSGTNAFHGDVFGYFTTKGLVREVKPTAIPFTGAAPSGFSEIDAGVDIGGPIIKNKLYFFGAFNPQQRKNFFLTQTFLTQVNNKVTTPFYAGKLTWDVNSNHRFNFSTFADYTKQEGHLFGFSGFGANPASFRGTTETGGSNYAFRLNSTFTPTWIGEFSFGLHFQRANTIPELDETLITDRFAVLRGGAVVTPIETTVVASNGLRLAFVEGTGGTVQRNFVRGGFGLKSLQDRDRIEFAARFQNIWGRNTVKYGFEWTENRYKIDTTSTGPNFDFTGGANPPGPHRIENRFAVCARTSTTTITCPDATRAGRVQAIITAGQGPAGATTAVVGAVSINPTNPFLLLDTVRARDFSLNTQGEAVPTRTESFYIQDDFKVTKNFQFNIGLRWDFQQAYSTNGATYVKLNNFKDNLQPRVGFIWDFTGEGRGKVFLNYARYLETPIPLDVNIRASGGDIQNDFNLNVSRLNGAGGAVSILNFGNLGNHATPFDFDIKPQTVNEATAGIEWSPAGMRDLSLGFRGIYRAQGSVIEDGSFDDGGTYFIFNPGESATERLACADPAIGCFGRARRYYRALEFTSTKRFSNNYQFIASYVYSSLIGNYEGLFRNVNGQSDPNFTSLFDLVSLLNGRYGRLPNDRPHQLKINSSYRTPFKLLISGNFYAQSGIPFNALVPHPLYGDNEGFCIPGLSCVPRGTAINPFTGSNRTPTTYNLDLGAYYPISVGEDKELRLSVDWFNVFNTQRAIRQDETFLINSGSPGITPAPNPFWGTGTIFQFPSALRLGAKFTF